ncbi:MAG: response regulator transcription factor [Bryobacteraceae bacterium]|nr:response regulator transcription factor [Bryobacteraceae bacterium]
MRVVIAEDEPSARDLLVSLLRQCRRGALVEASLSTVAATVAWLKANPPPDLLLLDIQLGDGSSFEVFRQVEVACPVIFTTAYDDYVLQAFEANGIDYLLKPIRADRMAAALDKYDRLRGHFTADYSRLLKPARRERFLVRKGADLVSIPVEQVAYCFTEDKLVFLVTKDGRRSLLDKPLGEIEGELDASRFFRVSRAFLVSIEAVARCSAYTKGRLALALRPPIEREVIVSQERAAAFRQWLGE